MKKIVMIKGGAMVVALAIAGTGVATVSAASDWQTERAALHQEAMVLHEAGDHEAAKDLMRSNRGNRVGEYGEFAERWQERHEEREARRAEMQEIFETGDYDAFLVMQTERHEERIARMEERGKDTEGIVAPEITLEQFQIMQEVHELRASGDHEAARELAEESDLPGKGMGKGKSGKGHGWNK